ncbi:MAG: YitT family protein [Bacteroidales bacterium]|nr:YitT family protein [Bacteroidales bacterium]
MENNKIESPVLKQEDRKTVILSVIKILIGSFFVAASFVFFFTPHKIVPGGVYGIAIVIHYLTEGIFSAFPSGLPVGTVALLFNIPLVIIATCSFGKGYLARTILTFVSTAVFTDLLTWIQNYFNVGALAENDILLSCIFGSAILGFGVAMVLKAKGTGAGTDVLAKLLTKKTKIAVGYTLIIVDSIVVLSGLIAFHDIEATMYSLFVAFFYGKLVDVFMQGLSFNKAVFIVSNNYPEIGRQILSELHRGGTLLHGKGLFNGDEKEILYTVLDNRQISRLRSIVHSVDPAAFITIIDAQEIIGLGFKPTDNEED